ncbi:MAG: DNA starvation/stationary phase protection protein [Planctomycetota bacterium]|nr:DNA starvation/stationary phase protection protein [Planctomycetota bacterium]
MSGSQFRSMVDVDKATATAAILQPLLTDITDLSLLLKHAHWNVRGALFQPLHEQLDKIVETARDASDEIAERMVTLGIPADGLVQSIAATTRLNPLHKRFLPTQEVIEEIGNRIHRVIGWLREAINETGNLDPVTQDMLIGICGPLEKHLWMLQSQQL